MTNDGAYTKIFPNIIDCKVIGNNTKSISSMFRENEVTDKKIASIQKNINSRPRNKLKFKTQKADGFKRIMA